METRFSWSPAWSVAESLVVCPFGAFNDGLPKEMTAEGSDEPPSKSERPTGQKLHSLSSLAFATRPSSRRRTGTGADSNL